MLVVEHQPLEAVCGNFYLAVLVARRVSLYRR